MLVVDAALVVVGAALVGAAVVGVGAATEGAATEAGGVLGEPLGAPDVLLAAVEPGANDDAVAPVDDPLEQAVLSTATLSRAGTAYLVLTAPSLGSR